MGDHQQREPCSVHVLLRGAMTTAIEMQQAKDTKNTMTTTKHGTKWP